MRHVIYITLIIAVAVSFLGLVIYGENSWLADRVIPTAGTKLPEWLDNFQWWAILGIVGSSAASLLWYALGQWAFNFNSWNRNYRPIWLLLLILVPPALAVLSCLYTKQTIEGVIWAYIFYFANNILTFYFATLMFSPSPVMYTPIGAEYVRRW